MTTLQMESNQISKYEVDTIKRYSLDECIDAIRHIKARIDHLTDPAYENLIKKDIGDLGLSYGARHALSSNGINTVADLLKFGVDRVWQLRLIGDRKSEEIKEVIEKELRKSESPQILQLTIEVGQGSDLWGRVEDVGDFLPVTVADSLESVVSNIRGLIKYYQEHEGKNDTEWSKVDASNVSFKIKIEV